VLLYEYMTVSEQKHMTEKGPNSNIAGYR